MIFSRFPEKTGKNSAGVPAGAVLEGGNGRFAQRAISRYKEENFPRRFPGAEPQRKKLRLDPEGRAGAVGSRKGIRP